MSTGQHRNDTVEPATSGREGGQDSGAGGCLVIVLGQTRASGATSESFDRFLIAPLAQGGRVDIALCRCAGYGEKDGYFASKAAYIWEIPEPASWNHLFDEAADQACGGHSSDWHPLIDVRGNWLGEIDEAGGKRRGSAARCLYLRHHALAMIRSLALERRYRWFILTRSDYLYRFEHPPLRRLDPRCVWIPRGEDYEGITDRHVVFPSSSVGHVLGVLDDLLQAPSEYRRIMACHGDWNLERFLKLAFIRIGLYRRTRRYPRVMYLVRNADTATAWSKGVWDGGGNVFVKYPSEKSLAEADVAALRKAGGWHSMSLRSTLKEMADRALFAFGPMVYSAVLAARLRLATNSHRLAGGAALLGCLGVVFALAGMFGARESLVTDSERHTWDISVQMLLVHATTLLCLSVAMNASKGDFLRRRLAQTGLALFFGALLFGAGFGGAAISGKGMLGYVGALGGIILIAGWGLLAVVARKAWKFS